MNAFTATTFFHRILLAVCSILFFAACSQPATNSQDQEDEKSVTTGENLQLQPGFEASLLLSPSEEGMGSWVSLTKDHQGHLIASDQYGGLYRIILSDDPAAKPQVDSIPVALGTAQGLLWAYNSLYVVVNASEKNSIKGNDSGFYRVTDSDGDGELDLVTQLKSFSGEGEHGPHTVRLAPDGKSLYVVGGNHTDLPENFSSRMPNNWATDKLMPTIKDPRGHAAHIKPPGAWVAETDSLGSAWELVSVGYRNPYDIAFNESGELFIFDSDMEWDLGMPWYRPVRVCHVTSGSEYGWRTGSDKWSAYYPDNLPPVANIGQGSPTGVVMGTGAKFPARYQHALYVFDWSFGTMYQVNLIPDGSSYRGEVEEFLSGIPLPLTDGVIGDDGAMYFTTGGRRLGSGLYRVTYTGSEATAPAALAASPADAQRELRHQLERWQTEDGPEAVSELLAQLGSDDRFMRFAARTGLEKRPVSKWKKQVLASTQSWAKIEGAIAMARAGKSTDQAAAFGLLDEIDWEASNEDQQLGMIRAYGLLCSRLGKPNASRANQLIARLDPHFPANSDALNRELSQTLAYLNAPSVVDKTLALMASEDGGETHAITISEALTERSDQYGPAIADMLKNMPPTQEIAYVLALSQVDKGWTAASRETYFRWFFDAMGQKGGVNYRGFIDAIRSMALERVPAEEKPRLAEMSGQFETPNLLADLPQPKGPGKTYGIQEVRSLMNDHKDEPRDFLQGEKMYAAAMCGTCHSIRGNGSNIGPDLTQIGTRFSVRDLMLAIMSPSDEISDQYAYTVFKLKDGSVRVGRVVGETDDNVVISPNPYAPNETVEIALAEVSERSPSPVSPMPPALINRLNEKELMDLMAYLLSGGDKSHEMYSAK